METLKILSGVRGEGKTYDLLEEFSESLMEKEYYELRENNVEHEDDVLGCDTALNYNIVLIVHKDNLDSTRKRLNEVHLINMDNVEYEINAVWDEKSLLAVIKEYSKIADSIFYIDDADKILSGNNVCEVLLNLINSYPNETTKYSFSVTACMNTKNSKV